MQRLLAIAALFAATAAFADGRFSAADVPAAVRALQARGMVFVDRGAVQPSEKGALTQPYLGGVTFELVHSHLKP